MRWQPHVTVAAIIEQDGKFLIVEEVIQGETRYNQPAGHWEQNESLIEAVIRETREETAWDFEPTHLLGIYHWSKDSDLTYLRFAFTGNLIKHHPHQALDTGITRAYWASLEEINQTQAQHRSPQVLYCIHDYYNGKRFPLDCLVNVRSL